jgi:PleD family two-component response regulator
MTLDRGHALVWLLNALSSGVPATLAASGILSRSATAQRLEAEISRSRRYSNPLSCIVVAAGGASEEMMAVLARALKGQLRWVDQLGQWRDDTLLVVLPETDQTAARGLTDKVRRSIAALPPVNELPISIGCATWRRGEGAEQLVERARTDARFSGDPASERRRR